MPATDPEVAFKDCDVAILVGAIPRREGMERKDLLTQNAKIFKGQGDCLNRQAKKSVKVGVRQDDGDLSALVAVLDVCSTQHRPTTLPPTDRSLLLATQPTPMPSLRLISRLAFASRSSPA